MDIAAYLCISEKDWIKIKNGQKNSIGWSGYLKILFCGIYLLLQDFDLWCCLNLMMMHAKGRYNLLKELEQLKHSLKIKNAVANTVTTQCKKQCQILQSLTKEKNQTNYWYLV